MAATVEIQLADASDFAIDAALSVLSALGASALEIDEHVRPAVVLALFVDLSAGEARARVSEALALAKVGVIRCDAREAERVDWGSVWKAAIKPISIGPLWIAPAGTSAPPPPAREGEPVLSLEIGGAFGSGFHETTALCLERIVELSPIEELLDVGTGTGILALAAAALGAERVVAIDADPEALRIAEENARRNQLVRAVTFSSEPLSKVTGQFRVVVANILASPLMELAPELVRKLGPRGVLILSGLREAERGEVARAYQRLGLRPPLVESRGGWVRLEMLASW